MSETPSEEITHAIQLLHSAQFWYEKYDANLAMRENGHARTVKALQIIADEAAYE